MIKLFWNTHYQKNPISWDKGDGQGPVSEADLEIDKMLFESGRSIFTSGIMSTLSPGIIYSLPRINDSHDVIKQVINTNVPHRLDITRVSMIKPMVFR